MPSMPLHARNQMLDAIPTFGTYYLALFTSAPNITTGGGTEVSGGGYAREIIPGWPDAANGELVLDGLQLNGATGSWGTITHWGIMDGPTGTAITNFFFMGEFASSFVVNSGDIPYIPPDQIVITLD